jgi:hypothetical protein
MGENQTAKYSILKGNKNAKNNLGLYRLCCYGASFAFLWL